jgi:hypothetical protein
VLNTNGGRLSYMHSGMYGICTLQESVRQMRDIAPAQVDLLEWFRNERGYQTRINAIIRAYINAHASNR